MHAFAIEGYDRVSAGLVFARIAHRLQLEHPGWFPLAPVPLSIWLLDPRVFTVKLWQLLTIVANFGLFAFICRRLTSSTPWAIVAVVFTLCAWQFRTVHDPVIGTSLVTPWLGLFVFSSFALWTAYRAIPRVTTLALCCAALALAMATSPLAWAFAIVLVVIAFRAGEKRAAIALGSTAIPLVVATVLLSPPEPPWQHGGAFLANVAAQLFASLPTSFRATGALPIGHVPSLYHNGTHYIDDRFITIPAISFAGWLAVIACTCAAFFALRHATPGGSAKSSDAPAIGAAFVVIPALMLGERHAWPHGLPWGFAFDSIYFAYFGFGLLAALAIRRIVQRSDARALAPSLAALLVFLLAYGNVRADNAAIERTQRADDMRGLIQRAAGTGIFRFVPEGSSIALSAKPSSIVPHEGFDDAKYMLYHYTRRRYATVDESNIPARPRRDSWIVQTSRASGIFMTIAHVAGRKNEELVTDRAYGYTVFPDVWRNAPTSVRGIQRHVVPVRDGALIFARRTCGPVPVADALMPDFPTVVWTDGFYPSGPVGYTTDNPEPLRWGLGQSLTLYPKVFMESHGTLTIYPSNCPPTAVNVEGVAVAARRSSLRILSSSDDKTLVVSAKPAQFWLRYAGGGNTPIHVRFTTDAPPADFDPIIFRYERDRPRDIRLVIQVDRVWEDLSVSKAHQ